MTDKIIDGIDVSECDYVYTDRYNDLCCSCSISKDSPCKPSEMRCCFYVDHLKTELKEKEQECDALKNQLDFAVQQKECLEQECEKLKKQLEQQEVLTETYKACYRAKHNDVKGELIKLKQALDEIYKVANNREVFCERCSSDDNFSCEDCGYCKILDIINKAKESTNE